MIPALVVAALVVAGRLGYFDLTDREGLLDTLRRIRQIPWLAPVFVASYTVAVMTGLPTTALSILGGALFGTLHGALLAWGGALVGTIGTHTLARSIGKSAVSRLLGKHRLLRTLRQRADVLTLMRLRVLPVAPFGVLDYVAGLAGVPLRPLFIATAIGIIPGTLTYAYAGDRLRLGLETPGGAGKHALTVAVLVTLLASAIAIGSWIVSRHRSEKT